MLATRMRMARGVWDGYLYKEGDEYEHLTGGWYQYYQVGSGLFTRNVDNLYLYADYNPNGEVSVGATNAINLTNANIIKVRWANTGNHPTAVRSYFGVDKDITKIRRDGGAEILLYVQHAFAEKTDSIDVSALSGEYYIGVSAQLSSSTSGNNTLYVYEAWVE